MKVTDLKPQRRSNKRYNVYLDGSYAFSLDKQTLENLNWQTKDLPFFIDEKEIEKAIFLKEAQNAIGYALNLLAYRLRSEKEIRARLKGQGYSEMVIEKVVQDLKESGFLDDCRFAQTLTEDLLNYHHKGRRYIFAELKKKGIAQEIIENLLRDLDEKKSAQKLVQRYQDRYRSLGEEERYQKLYSLLARRGFLSETIEEVLEHDFSETK